MARIYSVNSRATYEAELDKDQSIGQESKDYIIHKVLNGRWFSGRLNEKYGNEDLWAQ